MRYIYLLWTTLNQQREKTIDHCNPFMYTGF